MDGVQTVHDNIHFWLDCSVDGLRVDSIDLVSKRPNLLEAKTNKPGNITHLNTADLVAGDLAPFPSCCFKYWLSSVYTLEIR